MEKHFTECRVVGTRRICSVLWDIGKTGHKEQSREVNKVWSRANEDGIEMKFFPLTGDHVGSPLRKPGKLTESSGVTLVPSSTHDAIARFPCEKPSFWAPASPLFHKTRLSLDLVRSYDKDKEIKFFIIHIGAGFYSAR